MNDERLIARTAPLPSPLSRIREFRVGVPFDPRQFGDSTLKGLSDDGYRQVTLARAARLGVDPEYDVRFVAFLRDATGHGIEVAWNAHGLPHCDLTLLAHLPPPQDHQGRPDGALAAWRTSARRAPFYYRQGPNFVTITDRRASWTGTRFLLSRPEALDTFHRLTEPLRLDDLPAASRMHVPAFQAARLAVTIGPWLVGLPYRLHRRPILPPGLRPEAPF